MKLRESVAGEWWEEALLLVELAVRVAKRNDKALGIDVAAKSTEAAELELRG